MKTVLSLRDPSVSSNLPVSSLSTLSTHSSKKARLKCDWSINSKQSCDWSIPGVNITDKAAFLNELCEHLSFHQKCVEKMMILVSGTEKALK